MTRRPHHLRPRGADDLGLRAALSDRLLPLLVAAMAFLAALALAGLVGARALAGHWQRGAGSTVTVQVPDADEDSRLDRTLAALRATPGVRTATPMPDAQLQALLRPWLGTGSGRIALRLPAVVTVTLEPDAPVPDLATVAATAAPGALAETPDLWLRRLATLARSLQALAALAVALVAFVAAAVVTVATRAGLALRRDAIEIVHGLGATDRFIAARFSRRATWLAGTGAAAGAILALPVLLALTALAAPFAGADAPTSAAELAAAMPAPLWLAIPVLPLLAAALGWTTAQVVVRRWLRRLP